MTDCAAAPPAGTISLWRGNLANCIRYLCALIPECCLIADINCGFEYMNHACKPISDQKRKAPTSCLLCSPTQAFNFAFKDTIKETFPKYNSSVSFLRKTRFRKHNPPQFLLLLPEHAVCSTPAGTLCDLGGFCFSVFHHRSLLKPLATLGPADRLLEILWGEHGVRRRRGRRLPAVRVPAGLCADASRR